MIWIITISLFIYFYSLILILKEKRFYDRIHAAFYLALLCLLINDLNTHRYLIEGYNIYAHIIITIYSLYHVYKHYVLNRKIKEHLRTNEPVFISWQFLTTLDFNETKQLNNNKIKTSLKEKDDTRMVFVSVVSQDSIADNYINDFYKKIRVISGSCLFYLVVNDSIEKKVLNKGDTIETNPMQEHWFMPNGQDVVCEVICVKDVK